jgi:hypothetical protein
MVELGRPADAVRQWSGQEGAPPEDQALCFADATTRKPSQVRGSTPRSSP